MSEMSCLPRPTAKLFGLPNEVHYLIIHHLNFPATEMLRATCRHFYNLIPRPTLHDLLQFETNQFCRERLFYTCTMCIRLRHLDKFADGQLRPGRGYTGIDTFTKFCLDCGLKWLGDQYARYPPGSVVAVQGVEYVVCWKCKKFGLRNRSESHRSDCRYQTECHSCWNMYEPFRRELDIEVKRHWVP